MLGFLAAASILTGSPESLSEASRAIAAGRVEQGRLMISSAIASGATGEPLERAMADLEFASGNCRQAQARYSALFRSHPDETFLAERGGIAALTCGDRQSAGRLLAAATAARDASWRSWNARGVLADMRQDWADADLSYARAEALAPTSAGVANNRGWSMLLRGRWTDAALILEQAAALDPGSARIAGNLELARAALDEDLPERKPGESLADWAARLNDAGVVAQLQGLPMKASAAFSSALEARGKWFDRAANNLKLAQGAQ
jgi:Flp pilus assembly protein TadD